MMLYLGLIGAWLLLGVVLLILFIFVTVFPMDALPAAMVAKVLLGWLGVGVVGIVFLGVRGYLVVKSTLGSIKQMIEEVGELSGQETFLPVIEPSAQSVGEATGSTIVSQWTNDLEAAGFEHEGDFQSADMHNAVMSAFYHPERKVSCGIFHVRGRGEWMEVWAALANGQYVLVTNVQAPQSQDQRPEVVRVSQPGAGLAEMLEMFEKNKPEAEHVGREPGTFVQVVESIWWRDKLWRHKKGGVSLEEVQRQHGAGTAGDKDRAHSQEKIKHAHALLNKRWADAWEALPGVLANRYVATLAEPGSVDRDDAESLEHCRYVASFEGQTLEDFLSHLNSRLELMQAQQEMDHQGDPEVTQTFKPGGFRPAQDGEKLKAAAAGQPDGLAAGEAVARAHPDWFKPVHRGSHPMVHAVYEVVVD